MSSANFHYALERTLEIEGGYSDHPADPGGKTMYGITERLWRAYCAERFNEQSPKSIEAITLGDAHDLYYNVFWDSLRLSLIHDRDVAAEVFDMAVNHGAGDAQRMLQEAANAIRTPAMPPLRLDGLIGPVTRGRVQSLILAGYKGELLKAMAGERYAHFKRQGNQSMIRGWLRKRVAL